MRRLIEYRQDIYSNYLFIHCILCHAWSSNVQNGVTKYTYLLYRLGHTYCTDCAWAFKDAESWEMGNKPVSIKAPDQLPDMGIFQSFLIFQCCCPIYIDVSLYYNVFI